MVSFIGKAGVGNGGVSREFYADCDFQNFIRDWLRNSLFQVDFVIKGIREQMNNTKSQNKKNCYCKTLHSIKKFLKMTVINVMFKSTIWKFEAFHNKWNFFKLLLISHSLFVTADFSFVEKSYVQKVLRTTVCGIISTNSFLQEKSYDKDSWYKIYKICKVHMSLFVPFIS